MRHRWVLVTGYCSLLLITACALPVTIPALSRAKEPAATPIPAILDPSTSIPTDTPTPAADLGTDENPILLALPPTQFPNPVTVANGQKLATLIEEQTGYHVVAVAPSTYSELINAMQAGNAHLAALPMFAIVQAYQQDAVDAAFASVQENVASYGLQFIARSDRFTTYFDPTDKNNTLDAFQALKQFSGKKACWSEPTSPSGYLVPAGILGWYQIPIQEGAFLQSQFAVVRAVRFGEICDFGATYIDARTYPALKDEYPFIMNDVAVIWQVPPIIPYDGIFFSRVVPAGTQEELKKALDLIFISDEGKPLFASLFGIQGLTPVDDIFYVEFTRYIQSSGTDWKSLVH